MTKNIFRMSAVIAMAGVISSCGGNGGQPLTGSTQISGVMGNFNTTVVTQLPQSNSAPTLPGGGGLSTASTDGIQAMAATTCETITPDPTVDADSDSIAKTKSSVFNCTDLSSGGTTYTRKGSMTVVDGNDAVAGILGGLRVDFDISKYNSSTTTSSFEGSYSGFWNYTSDGSSLTSTSKFSGYAKSDYTNIANYNHEYNYVYDWYWKHTPDNFASPWTTGAVEFSGTYTFDGRLTIEVNGVHQPFEGTYVMKYYTKNLRFQTGCGKWFNSGSIYLEDGNGSVFEIRYNCASAQLYLNGVASTIWAP